MDRKLTLNINEDLIEFAHDYSKKSRRSISSIVEELFRDLKSKTETSPLPQKTGKLYGSLENLNLPDKKTLRKRFHEKGLD